MIRLTETSDVVDLAVVLVGVVVNDVFVYLYAILVASAESNKETDTSVIG